MNIEKTLNKICSPARFYLGVVYIFYITFNCTKFI